jgi:hypothetical protein
LAENCVHDSNTGSNTGQLLTRSFMDYAMPLARRMPFFPTELPEGGPCGASWAFALSRALAIIAGVRSGF